jgi:hypothetical protein
MREETDKKDAILSRVERLEEQNRRLKRGALACLVIAASITLFN